MSEYKLPILDSRGFCNIFFSAIGGDGANMAAKMLFKIGVSELGLDGGYDAKYGSEKKGTPTDVSVRFCKLGTPVRFAGPSNKYNILVCFREQLISLLHLNRGLQADAIVICNTERTPDEIRDELKLHSGTIYTLDASKIAVETNSRLNMPMLAVLCQALQFPLDKVKESIAKQWPYAAKQNLAAFERALGTAQKKYFPADGKYKLEPPAVYRPPIGYENLLIGGAMPNVYHLTSWKDNSKTSSGLIPDFHPDECIGCATCTTVCADPGAIIWDKEKNKVVGIDKTFCKGCMRCVVTCPEHKKGKALRFPAELEVAI